MNRRSRSWIIVALMAAWLQPAVVFGAESERVVLLHGLARSAASMQPLADHLQEAGYSTCNIDYPSRHHTIEALAADFVMPALEACFEDLQRPVHFVTHSLGGILSRQLASTQPELMIGRVVMLAPPNHGSQVVDVLGDLWLFSLINGPAGQQLGTAADSIPNSLGAAPFELGVITGDFSINLILSTFIDGQDDGKVAVESAKLEGMRDFLVLPVSHPFIMKNRDVWKQVRSFLKQGFFDLREGA